MNKETAYFETKGVPLVGIVLCVSEERNCLNTNHCNHLNLSAYLDVYPVYVYDIELRLP